MDVPATEAWNTIWFESQQDFIPLLFLRSLDHLYLEQFVAIPLFKFSLIARLSFFVPFSFFLFYLLIRIFLPVYPIYIDTFEPELFIEQRRSGDHPIFHCFTISVLHRRSSNVQMSFRFHRSVSFRSDVNWVANEYLLVHRFIRQEEEGQELFQTLLFQCTSTNCSPFLSSFIEVLSKLGSIYLCFSLLL